MLILGVIVSILFLGMIIRLVLSSRTDRLVKRAALIALGVIGLAIVGCLIMAVAGFKEPETEEVFAGFPLSEPEDSANPGRAYTLIFGSIMLALIGFIILMALREKTKTAGRKLRGKMNHKAASEKNREVE
ncbi:MAG: hypothetical protein LBK63_10370 [Treponema sp.]|nr:hypothetical protein [Treponema sp.]